MPVYVDAERRIYQLNGGNVSYVLYRDLDDRLLNLYWGPRVPERAIVPELSCYPDGASFDAVQNRLPWELPTWGSGWYGTPALSVKTAEGDEVTDLRVTDHFTRPGKPPIPGLPATYTEDDSEAETLGIVLRDPLTGLGITVFYSVYAESGAITRSMVLTNGGGKTLTLGYVMSASLPLWGSEYDCIHLKGGWAKERQLVRRPLGESETRIFSQRGASGHEENPFLALCERSTTEHRGSVWAMNLIYSGSYLGSAFVDNLGNTRLSLGLNPDVFSWQLDPGETFRSPEAVLVYSDSGLNGMSHIYHSLYRSRLVRGYWRDRPRPILLNNWEATYFDFDEEKLLTIARSARELGVELFVLDDGWFGRRNTDNCSLGDWVVNREKLPRGLSGLSESVNALGLRFGIWVEPEMVSPDSDLYRVHPDWCLHVDGRTRTEMRQQLILDLSRTEVQDFIIRAISDLLRSANISYVKWDMNRNMTEFYSPALPPSRRKETQHRYLLGLYRVLETVTTAFPEVLFEGCSGGGGRFDGGILHYMPQIWCSDNTDAADRLRIQYGTSLVYPPCTVGSHVSAVPNHQTGRSTGMEFRGHVALSGAFGFELDLSILSDADRETARQLVETVKSLRELTLGSSFTRLLSPFETDYAAWQFTAVDTALVCVYRLTYRPNTPPLRLKLRELDENAWYEDESGSRYSGAALRNAGLSVSLKGDNQSKLIRLKKV